MRATWDHKLTPRAREHLAVLRRGLRMAADRVGGAIAREGDDLIRETSTRATTPLTPVDRLRLSSTALVLLGSILLGFVAYLVVVSPATAAREQQLLHEELRFALANSTSPVSQVGANGDPLPMGTPVALLEARSIDLSAVVVEGTDSNALQVGPGHRRDTVMPGQRGASVIFGRQAAFGGPFGQIASLREGDSITTTTGQGVSTFRVVGVRTGPEALPDVTSAQGTLTLVTATGVPFFAAEVLRVDAVLVGSAFDAGGRAFSYPALPDDELAMSSQSGAAADIALWSILLLGGVLFVPALRRHWGRWQAWLVGVPLIGSLSFVLYRDLSALLPNLT